MNLNDYRLNAYNRTKGKENASSDGDASDSNPKGSGGSKSGSEPLVYVPVFEKISRQPEKKSNDDVDSNFKRTLEMAVAKQRSQSASPERLPVEPEAPRYSTRKNLAKGSTVKSIEDLKAEEDARLAARSGTWFAKKNTTEEEVKAAAAKLTSGGLIMVPAKEKKEGEKESIYRRVAKFLVVIGIDEAAKILPHLTQEQTEKIVPEIASIRSVSPEEAQEVVEEFKSLLTKARESGGVDTARTILTKAYGSKKAAEVLNKVVKHPNGKPFDYLFDADPERIGILIDGESVSVQAIVLSRIEPKKAAKVINMMEPAVKSDVVMRLAKLKPVASEVLDSMSASLYEKMMTQNTENTNRLDGASALAQILKRMDPSAEYSIIASLSEENPELGAKIRRKLFTEEDVIKGDDRYMQKKLHDMTDSDLVYLLRGKSDAFRAKIFSNISRQRGRIIEDEELIREHLLKSDCEKVTLQFYGDLRRAWEVGEFIVEDHDIVGPEKLVSSPDSRRDEMKVPVPERNVRKFTDEEVVKCRDRYVQEALHGMNDSEVVVLMCGKDKKFRNKILRNISSNRNRILAEEERLKEYLVKSYGKGPSAQPDGKAYPDASLRMLKEDMERAELLFNAALGRAIDADA
ncbi:MAG: flagellar motor switch protein FliG [Treponema sp.]|nr:flagellar motor switch protein FliG [Treponema sp.]